MVNQENLQMELNGKNIDNDSNNGNHYILDRQKNEIKKLFNYLQIFMKSYILIKG